jgi:hypothetical protein
MKSERLSVYAAKFPKGLQSVSEMIEVRRSSIDGLAARYIPREPKEGEHLVRLRVDPNGAMLERGDIILSQKMRSPALSDPSGDWAIVAIREQFVIRNAGGIGGYYRYAVVKIADEAEAAECRAAMAAARATTMRDMMSR